MVVPVNITNSRSGQTLHIPQEHENAINLSSPQGVIKFMPVESKVLEEKVERFASCTARRIEVLSHYSVHWQVQAFLPLNID